MFPSIASSVLWTFLAPSLLTLTSAASLQEITAFSPNPTNTRMYIYVPDHLAANPPILVVPHWCHGKAQDVYNNTHWSSRADSYGYIVIYPDSPNLSEKCWDVSSKQSLTHNGGGDALGIVSMVKWALSTYNGNPDRVFATGVSSGAMMTNVLLGSYPDVFAAGSAWAGVAFGCFAGDGYGVWSDQCAQGKVVKSGAEWARIVYGAYPEYSGYRPKMQIAHGTVDQVLFLQNFEEEIKEWTAVFGINGTKPAVKSDSPLIGWTEYNYGEKFVAYKAANVTHDIKVQEEVVVKWFDLACTSRSCFSRRNAGNGTTITMHRARKGI